MEITDKQPEITNSDLLAVLEHQNEELRHLKAKLIEHDGVLREHTRYMKDVLKETGSFGGYLKQFAVNLAADFFGNALRRGR